MSAELATVLGLATTAFMVLKISQKFKESETMIEEAVNVLSIFFLIGLEYTAYGIAQANSLSKAADAYLVAIMITVLVFVGLLIQLVARYRSENKDETLGNFSLGN